MEWIILDAPLQSEAMREAREGLVRRIQEFMRAKERAALGLSEETISQWLRAVLMSWRALLIAQLPAKIRQELARLKSNLNSELFEL